MRPAFLAPGPVHPGDVVGRYRATLVAGDTEAIVSSFAPDGYCRESLGPAYTHCGASELGSFFTTCFSSGGGIGLEDCTVTDDGTRCALEYNCVRWGSHELTPQAGIAVFERGPDGLLAAAALLTVASADAPAWALGVGGSATAQRIDRLINPPRQGSIAQRAVTCAVLAAIAALAIAGLALAVVTLLRCPT